MRRCGQSGLFFDFCSLRPGEAAQLQLLRRWGSALDVLPDAARRHAAHPGETSRVCREEVRPPQGAAATASQESVWTSVQLVTFSTLVFADLHHSLGSRPQRTPEEPGHVCTYAAQILQLQIFLLFNVKSDARPRSPLTGSSSGNQVLTFESLRTKQRKVQRKKRFYRSRCTIKKLYSNFIRLTINLGLQIWYFV